MAPGKSCNRWVVCDLMGIGDFSRVRFMLLGGVERVGSVGWGGTNEEI